MELLIAAVILSLFLYGLGYAIIVTYRKVKKDSDLTHRCIKLLRTQQQTDLMDDKKKRLAQDLVNCKERDDILELVDLLAAQEASTRNKLS